MKYFKKLIGERIYLSPRSIEDVEQFTEWLNDFETTDYIGRSCINTTIEAEKKFLEKNSNGEIDSLILRDVTGDAYEYGIVTYANTDHNSLYKYDIGGTVYSLNSSAKYNIYTLCLLLAVFFAGLFLISFNFHSPLLKTVAISLMSLGSSYIILTSLISWTSFLRKDLYPEVFEEMKDAE